MGCFLFSGKFFKNDEVVCRQTLIKEFFKKYKKIKVPDSIEFGPKTAIPSRTIFKNRKSIIVKTDKIESFVYFSNKGKVTVQTRSIPSFLFFHNRSDLHLEKVVDFSDCLFFRNMGAIHFGSPRFNGKVVIQNSGPLLFERMPSFGDNVIFKKSGAFIASSVPETIRHHGDTLLVRLYGNYVIASRDGISWRFLSAHPWKKLIPFYPNKDREYLVCKKET